MNILLICTGNTCRSPMAEGIFKKLTADRNDIQVLSAGLAAYEGAHASDNAVAAMRSMGIDITAHHAHGVTKQLLTDADLILTMTTAHKNAIEMAFGDISKGKLHTIKEFAGETGEIDDPYGQNEKVYEICAEHLYGLIEKIVKKI